jgi:hypothetical protein
MKHGPAFELPCERLRHFADVALDRQVEVNGLAFEQQVAHRAADEKEVEF